RWLRRRTSSRTRAPAAAPPAPTANTGRTQLRGSRSARSSLSESSSAQSESSSAAACVTAESASSSRPERRSGGSSGRSASVSSCSTFQLPSGVRAGSLGLIAHLLLQLLDRPVDQDLGGAVAAPEGAGDLAVVHAESEAHDQDVAPVVGQLLQVG